MRRQLALQDAMDTVDYGALDPGYAEIGSTPGKNFRIWYRSAAEPGPELTRAMDGAGILPYVDFVRVPLSLPDLKSKAIALASRLNELRVGVTIDTARGGCCAPSAPHLGRGPHS